MRAGPQLFPHLDLPSFNSVTSSLSRLLWTLCHLQGNLQLASMDHAVIAWHADTSFQDHGNSILKRGPKQTDLAHIWTRSRARKCSTFAGDLMPEVIMLPQPRHCAVFGKWAIHVCTCVLKNTTWNWNCAPARPLGLKRVLPLHVPKYTYIYIRASQPFGSSQIAIW